MNETHERWADLLSEYLDGGLEGRDRQGMEEHLAQCGACRDELAELRAVVAAARQLGDVTPPRDLWPGIAGAIAAPLKATPSTVIPLPTASPAREAPGGLLLTRTQLAAAASILVVVSAGATWLVGPGIPAQGIGPGADGGVVAAALTDALPEAPQGLADELGALEAALAEAGARLDPETVRVIEKNLVVIERAIEDSRRALAADPGNRFLADHLNHAYRRKRDYLQSTVRVLEWAG